MEPLPPFVAFQTVRATHEEGEQMKTRYIQRLLAAWQDQPIPYRFENDGDYDSAGVLRTGIREGRAGFSLHCK